MNLRDVCNELSISYATGKNWVKLGKLIPDRLESGVPYFSANYVKKLKTEISSGENSALKSRRNKRFISGSGIYNAYVSAGCAGKRTVEELLAILKGKETTLTEEIIKWILAFCARQLFDDAGKRSGEYGILVYALISDRQKAQEFYDANPDILKLKFHYEAKEDVLGLIYISCKNLGNRKARGSYYTPSSVVKRVTSPEALNLQEGSTILDPCCGTGNFLLQLPDNVKFENVYGCDIDSVSVAVTRINMALRFPDASAEQIISHITEKDYLKDVETKATMIIGNPPWGYEFDPSEKKALKEIYKTADRTNFDSFDVFTEKALKDLEPQGELTFVLPEAILNVKSHRPVRELILENSSIESIEYLGDVFDGVNCPSIIIKLINTGKKLSTRGLRIDDGGRKFTIDTERKVDAESLSFLSTDEEFGVIRRIESAGNVRFLLNNADFALGIVTGDNNKYISGEKSQDMEMILRGSDIFKYRYSPSKSYILFKPESFQQVAPTKLYRAKEKLFYRFICNQPVFAYDDKQTLSLNSCNVLIPRIPELSVKYVMAILNSRVAQFYFKKQFNSVKILRNHIERMPIPYADPDTQNSITLLVDRLISGQEDAISLYDNLDELICDIYGLSGEDRRIIKEAVDGDNKFL